MEPTAKNNLLNYFNRRKTEILFRLTNSMAALDEEDIHQLRVEIKKIRSVLKLLDQISAGGYPAREYRRLLSGLFKPAGKFREDHINLSLLDRFSGFALNGYRQHLLDSFIRHSEKLHRVINSFDQNSFLYFHRQVDDKISLVDDETVLIATREYINEKVRNIKAIWVDATHRNKLHRTRKHLKALGYVMNIRTGIYSNVLPEGFYNLVKETETHIGNWHDRIVLINSLEKYSKKHPVNPELLEITGLISALKTGNHQPVILIKQNLEKIVVENPFEK